MSECEKPVPLTGDRQFESRPLQRRVANEPRRRSRLGPSIILRPELGDTSFQGLNAINDLTKHCVDRRRMRFRGYAQQLRHDTPLTGGMRPRGPQIVGANRDRS